MKQRKIYMWVAVLLMIFLARPIQVNAEVKAPKKSCHAYVVMDAGSGQVLFGQDMDKKIYPASTAKVMTAIVSVENGDMSKVIKTDYDVVYGTTLGTYCLGIGANVKYSLKDLLAMSLISSAADATDSLAVGVFGSKAACVEAMNKKCQELGLTGTHFDNPVGSDIGAGYNETYATAREMSLIVRYAMTKGMIRDLVRRSSYSPKGKDITANTTNRFIRGTAWYNDDKYTIIGTKSGTTNAAGHVFIATAMDKEGHEVICAFFGDGTTEETFINIRKLYDYTFSQYKKGNLTLTPSNYDVRCTDGFGQIYTKYAALNCFPGSKDGTFHKNQAVTRPELVRMLKGIDNMTGDPRLKTFMSANQKGKITSLDLALLVQKFYPSHLSTENVDQILEGCKGADQLTSDEREAFAIYLNAGLNHDEYCKNPGQVITRMQAVYFAVLLKDYQNLYKATSSNAVPGSAEDGSMTIGPAVATFNEEWQSQLLAYHTQKEQERAEIAAQKAAEKEAAEAATAEETTTEAATENKK